MVGQVKAAHREPRTELGVCGSWDGAGLARPGKASVILLVGMPSPQAQVAEFFSVGPARDGR